MFHKTFTIHPEPKETYETVEEQYGLKRILVHQWDNFKSNNGIMNADANLSSSSILNTSMDKKSCLLIQFSVLEED